MRVPSDILSQLLAVGEPDPAADDPRLGGLVALSAEMGAAPARDAPVRAIPARLGEQWSPLILLVLATGTYRHATLKRVVSALATEEEITQRMLTLCLRHLERDGLITRTTHPSNPPRVDYTLTPLGTGLVAEFKRLQGWILAHADAIAAARAAFDARDHPDAK